MSNINTSTINTNFPIPGTNNSSQGFRDNFSSIGTNLSTAATEITELQNNAILKTGLTGLPLNNDMANTVLSNVQTIGFRASSYDLGGSLPTNPNIIIIDVSSADMHFGILAGNTSFTFAGWSPTNTVSSVDLWLYTNSSTTPGATISFPNTTYDSSGIVQSGLTPSARLLENYTSLYAGTVGANASSVTSGSVAVFGPDSNMAGVIHTNTVSVPAGVQELRFRFTSEDCGTTIEVTPLNRNRQSTSMMFRTPTPIGLQGDMPGTTCTDGNNLYICNAPYDGSTTIWKKVALTNVT